MTFLNLIAKDGIFGCHKLSAEMIPPNPFSKIQIKMHPSKIDAISLCQFLEKHGIKKSIFDIPGLGLIGRLQQHLGPDHRVKFYAKDLSPLVIILRNEISFAENFSDLSKSKLCPSWKQECYNAREEIKTLPVQYYSIESEFNPFFRKDLMLKYKTGKYSIDFKMDDFQIRSFDRVAVYF